MSETTAQKIANMDAVLESGVTSDSRDGASTTLDHDTLRLERLRLQRLAGIRKRRPRMINVQMGRR
jgi:hypothetical protein